jgi:type VI secretion system protein ImpM
MPGSSIDPSSSDAAGFFGKLPGFPDFLSRRIPRTFLEPWDSWLQQGMTSSRERLGVSWLDTYLTSPIWRFLLVPGVCGANAWAGVFMPSVDRVGRHFPFTLAADLDREGGLAIVADSGWFDRLEHLALSALEDPFDLEIFDTDLKQLGLPAAADSPLSKFKDAQGDAVSWCFDLASLDSLRGSLPAIAETLLDDRLRRHTFWWTSGSEKVKPCLLTCRGLPGSSSFAGLLDGNWSRWGLGIGL